MRAIVLSLLLGSDALALADQLTFTTISVPNGIETIASGINDAMQIVEYMSDLSTLGFLDVNGVFTTISEPNADPNSLFAAIASRRDVLR